MKYEKLSAKEREKYRKELQIYKKCIKINTFKCSEEMLPKVTQKLKITQKIKFGNYTQNLSDKTLLTKFFIFLVDHLPTSSANYDVKRGHIQIFSDA